MDYFVPNFGRDEGINHTWNSLDWAERNLKHKFNPTMKWDVPKGAGKDYFVPDFGLEEDVVDTLNNIKYVEKRDKSKWNPVQDENGVWIVPEPFNSKSYSYAAQVGNDDEDVQLEKTSDPICSSANPGCNTGYTAKPDHPVDYKVPNFGIDHDIIATQKHIKDQEAKHGAWTPKQDDNGVW